ncbi:MAG: hypothetical protein ABR498_05120, partial [Candidatus Dormibacteria bacterium]
MTQLVDRDQSRLGQVLLRRGVIDEPALETGLERHMKDDVRLGEALVADGAVSQDDVWRALATQWGIGMHDISHHWVDPALANELDAREA